MRASRRLLWNIPKRQEMTGVAQGPQGAPSRWAAIRRRGRPKRGRHELMTWSTFTPALAEESMSDLNCPAVLSWMPHKLRVTTDNSQSQLTSPHLLQTRNQISDERWGLLAYAGSVFCSSMMSVFARLASDRGVSPWQIVFVRSCLLLAFSSCSLASAPGSPFGSRCGVDPSRLPTFLLSAPPSCCPRRPPTVLCACHLAASTPTCSPSCVCACLSPYSGCMEDKIFAALQARSALPARRPRLREHRSPVLHRAAAPPR
jgi:hypothetical protein